MKQYKVKIQHIEELTHDIRRIVTDKPLGYTFIPGQATEVAVNLPGIKEERRPFTFTSTNSDNTLEFIIKVYRTEGITDVIGKLQNGDDLIISEVFGSMEYKGPGYFIAGGVGITPFLAILRQLFKEGNINGHELFFSNKTRRDIILEDELKHYLAEKAVFTLTRENNSSYDHGHINLEYLKKKEIDFNKYFYICGTPEMNKSLSEELLQHGVAKDKIIYEQ